ncbi:NAD(P)-binding domain-containing protein [Teichococcus vastitatis]|uniref:NAD(P)-binding domain-containing protein n=1 Tax=Teichococcus vastitatis TaxID=2307076 RepID=A0ABS9W879_9PROT|nr:NAD(P)-binding domain-containing protein [Pseudoroseomonas vastitatis]
MSQSSGNAASPPGGARPRLGFIGIGLMGSAMSLRLLERGWLVTVWNRERASLDPVLAAGATEASSPREVAERSDIVLICVLDTRAVEDCVWGGSGVAAAAGGARLLIDFSTIDADATRTFAARLREHRGIGWIDAPVSGGPAAAREGGLTVMAGGDEEELRAAAAVLTDLASNVTRMGPAGSGQVTKVLNQAIVGSGFVVMAEALHLAETAGIDAQALPGCLAGGFADSALLQRLYPLMQRRAFDPPLGYSRQLLKDMKAVKSFAHGLGLDLPMVETAAARFNAYVERGNAMADSVSIIRLYEQERQDGTRQEALPVIDAHQHFWNLSENYHPWLCDAEPVPFRYGDYAALRRNYLPADYRTDTAQYRVVGTVHIEAEFDPARPVAETEWLERLAAREGLPTACVAQARLDDLEVEAVLAAQAERSMVRGIRHKPRAAARPEEALRGASGSMDDPAWRRGYALLAKYGLSFDLQTPWWHLDAAYDLARDFPETQIIVNHTALPSDRSIEGLRAWRAALAGLARAPNVALKISGLGLPDQPWRAALNVPVIRDAITLFGADRCLFASNYPVDSLAGSFDVIMDGFLQAIADRTEAERRQLLHDNAVRLYRL